MLSCMCACGAQVKCRYLTENFLPVPCFSPSFRVPCFPQIWRRAGRGPAPTKPIRTIVELLLRRRGLFARGRWGAFIALGAGGAD